MKRILFFASLILVGCSNNDLKEQTDSSLISNQEKTINDYVSIDYQYQVGEIIGAINYGLTNALVSKETEDKFGKKIQVKEIDYTLAEKLTLEKLKLPFSDVTSNRVTAKTQSSEESNEEVVSEIIEVMSDKMMNYNNQMLGLFSIFEEEEKEDGWDTEEVIGDLISKFDVLQNSIMKDEDLQEWEKTALLASLITSKGFSASFEELSENISAASGQTGKFFKRIWRGVKKVARGVANIVVRTVAVSVRATIHAFGGMIHGAGLLGGSGILMAPFTMFGCGVVGHVSGFFGGVVNNFNCGTFDFKCILKHEGKYICEKKEDFS
ncbi:MAG: hypothetical protein Q4G08_10865 [Capnocytophaga sp.]|nr:hypothetical protein [Capnocytophaga sp.]